MKLVFEFTIFFARKSHSMIPNITVLYDKHFYCNCHHLSVNLISTSTQKKLEFSTRIGTIAQ